MYWLPSVIKQQYSSWIAVLLGRQFPYIYLGIKISKAAEVNKYGPIIYLDIQFRLW